MKILKLIYENLNISPIVLVIIICVSICLYFGNVYSYWSSRGVCGPPPIWIFGNLWTRVRMTKSLAEFDMKMYKENGGNNLCGFFEFTKPVLMIGNPQLLKCVMIKDFDHFTDRSFMKFNEPVMDYMLLGLKGSMWKKVRAAMTPTFTSVKIKQTFSLLKDCSENLAKFFDQKLETGCSVFEMKEVFGMFTMDTIASIAFGVNSNSLNNAEDEFSAAAARFFAPVSMWKQPLLFFQIVLPQMAKIVRLKNFDNTPVKFFTKVVSDTIQYRLKNGVRRSDFLQLLLDASIQEQSNANNNKKLDEKPADNERVLSELVITAQCVLFYMAGYDTTATTLSFASYCLALHPDIQQTLIEEVDDVVVNNPEGELSFDVIQKMFYLDKVLAETLRLFPPAPRVDRRCTKDYDLPGTSITIPKHMKVSIPIYSIHRDPTHYPDPDQFDPERFSQENKNSRSSMAYLPFGCGPRNCIGQRFALMETKVALVRVLREFAFVKSRSTQVPINLDRSSGLLKARDGVWVKVVRRS